MKDNVIPMDRLGKAVDEMFAGPNHSEEAAYWRDKYWSLLEQYHSVIADLEIRLAKEKI